MSETLACEIAKASCKCEGTTLAKTDFESVCACVEREKLLERHCCKPKRKRILELNSSSLRSVVISAGAHVRRDRGRARFVPIYIQTCS